MVPSTAGIPVATGHQGATAPSDGLSAWRVEVLGVTIDARRVLPHLPIAALVVAYALRFSLLSVSVYDGYGDPPFDMALFDQGIWLLSRFHAPFVTVMGRDLFGDHTAFILLLVVPLYWVFPHAQLLLVLQSCLLASAAIPIYLLARKRLDSTLLATALAATYLLNPALQNGNLEQFHPEAFLVLGVTLALYAAVEWHPKLLIASVVACMLVKQDTGFLIIPLTLWVAWRRNLRLGLAMAAACAFYTFLAFEVIIFAFLGTTSFQADRIPFGGTGGLLRTAIHHPGTLWNYARSDGRPFYLWQLGFSVGWGFLLAPELAAVAILTLLENGLSAFPYQHQIIYHYSMAIAPVFVIGTVFAIAAQASVRRRQVVTGVVFLAALWSCVLWGLAPFSQNTYAHQSPHSAEVADINAALRSLPANAVVSAWYPYVAHIDHRVRIYMWPTPFSASYWGLYTQEGQRLPFASEIQYIVLPTTLVASDEKVLASIASQYRVIDTVGDVRVYEKVAG
jgi:uncharacterized membrane protein